MKSINPPPHYWIAILIGLLWSCNTYWATGANISETHRLLASGFSLIGGVMLYLLGYASAASTYSKKTHQDMIRYKATCDELEALYRARLEAMERGIGGTKVGPNA